MAKRNSNRKANKAVVNANNVSEGNQNVETSEASNPLGDDVIDQIEPTTSEPVVVDATAAAILEQAQMRLTKAETAFADAKSELSEAKLDLAKLSGKKGGKEKAGPGVIATIFSLVSKADDKGITKAAILEKLIAMFPERASEGMEKTINVQLPKRMSKERDVKIVKSEVGGFYVEAVK
jgi:hypothetical protein